MMHSSKPTIESVKAEEAALQVPTFHYDFAWTLGSLIRQKAAERKHPVAVEVRHGNDVVFATLLPERPSIISAGPGANALSCTASTAALFACGSRLRPRAMTSMRNSACP